MADDEAEAKLDDGGSAQVQGRRKEEEERKGKLKEKEGVLRPIYKDKEISDMRGNRGAQKWIDNEIVASIVGCSLIKGVSLSLNKQVMSQRFTTNPEDDVRAVYKIYAKVQGQEFF